MAFEASDIAAGVVARPLRIGIDAHTVGNRRSGDESYTLGLVSGLADIDDRNHYTLYVTSEAARELLGSLPENFAVRRVRPHQRHTRLLFSLPVWLQRDRIDVAHFQYIAPPLLRGALVLTVHDVSYEIFPQHFGWMERMALRSATPLNMRRADKVLTVSGFSKQQIVDVYGLPPEKIAVTYNAVGADFSPMHRDGEEATLRARLGLERDYLLWVGNFVARKRPEVLIEAFRHLVAEGNTTCDLVLAGQKAGLYETLIAAVREAGLGDRVHFLGYVAGEDLPPLYRHARAFVFPSEYEGFGIPPLEAMSCGTPVVCSRGSSLPEVTGEAAVALDCVTPASLAGALQRVLGDPELGRELARRGLARARQFSWEDTARATLRAYEDAFLAKAQRSGATRAAAPGAQELAPAEGLRRAKGRS